MFNSNGTWIYAQSRMQTHFKLLVKGNKLPIIHASTKRTPHNIFI